MLGLLYYFSLKGEEGVKFINTLTVSLLAASMAVSFATKAATASSSDGLTETNKKAIEKLIHDYLVSNPEVLLEASQALQQKQQQTMQQQAQAAIRDNASQLLNEKLTAIGNPKAKVTLIEFFDYQCIHCKKMAPIVNGLARKDGNLRVVYKEFPIFGKSSDTASRAAIAAAMQGKYQAVHEALIKQDQRLNDELIMNAAKSAGVDMAKLKTDMNSKTVTEALEATRQLAEKLHLMGTPAFIVAATPGGQLKTGSTPTFIPGATSEEALLELIKKASANS